VLGIGWLLYSTNEINCAALRSPSKNDLATSMKSVVGSRDDLSGSPRS
jgi:hypothetical protein